MNLLKNACVLSVLVFSLSSAIAADAVITSDKDAVNSACASESATAKCGDEKVGTGLLKCLHAYKKANKDFKFSDSCKASMKKLHADKQAEKAEVKK